MIGFAGSQSTAIFWLYPSPQKYPVERLKNDEMAVDMMFCSVMLGITKCRKAPRNPAIGGVSII
jgi:hypothetical protein